MLTLNIVKANGKVGCRTLVRHLTPDEKKKLAGWIKHMANFDATIIVKLGNATTETDFNKSVLTPVYETYEPQQQRLRRRGDSRS